MLSYALKRIVRSFGLFAALLLGVVLASTFFAGVNIGADTTAQAALEQQLNRIPVDIVITQHVQSTLGSNVWKQAASDALSVNSMIGSEVISTAFWNSEKLLRCPWLLEYLTRHVFTMD